MRKTSESNKSARFGKRLHRMTKPIGFGVAAFILALLLLTSVKDAQAGRDEGAFDPAVCHSDPINGRGYCIGTDASFRNSSDPYTYAVFYNYRGSRIIHIMCRTGYHYLLVPLNLAEAFDTAILSPPEAVKEVFWERGRVTAIDVFRASFYTE